MKKINQKLRSLVLVSISGLGVFTGINILASNEKFYRNHIMPILHLLDAEKAHKLAIFASKHRLIPRNRFDDPELLRINIFGKELSNPVGIAAGFDKQAEAIMGLRDLGFGFMEVGSVTPFPQPGNEQPRVFRLPEDKAVINRYGFNSDGYNKVFERLQVVKENKVFNGIIGVNLGKNKSSLDPINDYVEGIKKFGPVADYLVINISSPNTPGLRKLQDKEDLLILLKILVETRNNLPESYRPPLLLKLAPDLSYWERQDIAEVVTNKECKIDGLIISNTTVDKSTLKDTKSKEEAGGLSGEPLRETSTKMIAEMYKLTNGMIIIGVGGIFTGKDAYDKIKSGACAIQLYTSMVFEGPPVVSKVKRELSELLAADGYTNISEAVGVDIKL